MGFDFQNAQLPTLSALSKSFAVDSVEDELKQLFCKLFIEHLGPDVFDANVLGMAHLGSLDLVRRAVNYDGLVLLRGDREEPATRYLYRAWKSGDVQGRGLHFLRTYLQMLFPNNSSAYQLYQRKDVAYPAALSETGGDDYFLTSRVQVLVDAEVVPGNQLDSVYKSIVSILPARFVPRIAVTKSMSMSLRVAAVFTPISRLDASGQLTSAPVRGVGTLRAAGVFAGFSFLSISGEIH